MHAVRAEPEHTVQQVIQAAHVRQIPVEQAVRRIRRQVTYVQNVVPVISWQAVHVRHAEPEHGQQPVQQVVRTIPAEQDVRPIRLRATYVQNVAAVIS